MLTSAELVWLMAAVAKGDEAAFERLYAATRAKLYGVALRILRRSDLADEVIQEAYLKIWHNAGSFDPKLASPITWMVAIARNRARQMMATYADMEELIRLGAYRAGSSAEVDEAIRLHQPLEAFLAQGKEESTSLTEAYLWLEQILGNAETEN